MMKTTCTFLGLLALVGLGLIGSGCSGGAETAAAQASIESNLTPEDQIGIAAAGGDVAKLKALLDMDANLINVPGPQGKSPLYLAAAAGQDAAVKLLLERGADPMTVDEDGNTAINAARAEGHKSTADLLVKAAGG